MWWYYTSSSPYGATAQKQTKIQDLLPQQRDGKKKQTDRKKVICLMAVNCRNVDVETVHKFGLSESIKADRSLGDRWIVAKIS